MQEGYINGQTPPQVTPPPDKMPRGSAGGQRDAQNRDAIRDYRQDHRFSGLPHAEGFAGFAREEQLRAARYAGAGHRRRIGRSVAGVRIRRHAEPGYQRYTI